MKKTIKWCAVAIFLVGCARVDVGSKEPIKLDVNMRLDIYQHVASDAASIEDMVSGPQKKEGAAPQQTSLFDLIVPAAYAQDASGFPAEVAAAIERRKARRERIVLLASQGYVGENKQGFIDIFDKTSLDSAKIELVEQENKDRLIIFEYVAKKNGASVAETGKIFAERIQKDAAAGTPIEGTPGQWVVK